MKPTKPFLTRKRLCILAVLLLPVILGCAALTATSEFRRIPSPDGRYYAVVSYRSYLSFIPMSPGSSSDKPGFITIYSSDGSSFGRAPIPALQSCYDFRWEPDAAEIRLVARWDLSKRSVTVFPE